MKSTLFKNLTTVALGCVCFFTSENWPRIWQHHLLGNCAASKKIRQNPLPGKILCSTDWPSYDPSNQKSAMNRSFIHANCQPVRQAGAESGGVLLFPSFFPSPPASHFRTIATLKEQIPIKQTLC